MEIIKVIGIAVLGMVCAGILKDVKPSLAAFAGIVTGIVILVSIVDELRYIVDQFVKIASIANVQDTMLLCRWRRRTPTLPPPEDMAIHRHGTAQAAHGERHSHRLVPHHSTVGPRTAPEVYRLTYCRPPARLPRTYDNGGHNVARKREERCKIHGGQLP